MYGRTVYFKYFELAMYGLIHFVGEAFSHGFTPVLRLYEFELISQMSQSLILSIWPPFALFTVDVRTYSHYGCTPVQKLYESGLRSQMSDAPFPSFWR